MRFLIVAAFFLLNGQTAFAREAWPRLEGGAGLVACDQALAVGRAAFQSEIFAVEDWRAVSPVGAAVVLSSSGEFGEEWIFADAATFVVMPPGGGEWERLHWARQANDGLRLVVVDYEQSWRGYNYEIFAIPEAMTPQSFRAARRANADPPPVRPLTAATWRPPIVLRDNATGALSVIDDWRVFIQSAHAFEPRCAVHFYPDTEHLLPAPVRLFAQRIDATLGQGQNEGTLQPTAAIRVALSQTWANVALRPWALNSHSVTPRPLIDSGLRRWARQAPSFRAAYDALISQYPRAQRALESYYLTAFHLTRTQSREMAAYALDFALRTAYHFHGRSDESVAVSSPWPVDAPRGS